MNKLCFLIALYISIGIANFFWVIVCILIYPFTRKWIYSFSKTTNYFLDTLIEGNKK